MAQASPHACTAKVAETSVREQRQASRILLLILFFPFVFFFLSFLD
jgi:hypothetical protein